MNETGRPTKVKFRDVFHWLRQRATIGSMEDEATDNGLTLEDMTKEVQQRLNLLSESLPLQIDPIGLSRTKLPFKVLNYREALIWRMVELSYVAFQAFQARQFAAAITLTRAAVETVAALWYLEEKAAAALKDDKLTDLDSYIMLLSGNYLRDDFPNPLRVRKFIEAVERRVPDLRMSTAD